MIFRCLSLSMRSLHKHRLRSFLCVISISIAVFSVISVINVGALGKSAVNTELEKTGLGGLLLHNGTTGTATIKNNALEIIRSTRGVREAGGVIMDKTTYSPLESEKFSEEAVLWSVTDGTERLISLETVKGRYFTTRDITQKEAVCMVDETVAQAISLHGEPIGSIITLKIGSEQHDFKIIGTVAAGGGILQNFTAFLPSMVFIPQSTYTAITGKSDYTHIAVRLNAGTDSEEIKLQLIRKLTDYGNVTIENLAKQKDSLTGIVDIITLIITAIGGISVVVAGFGIMTVMLMSVSERTREIGIKMALGAKRVHIVGEFLWESVILMTAGFGIGCTTALGGVWYASAKLGLDFVVPLGSIAICFVITVMLGVLFGGYPAHKAANMIPAAALNGE